MIHSGFYYWAHCDRCNKRTPPKDGDVTAWGGYHQAVDAAREEGWEFAFGKYGTMVSCICDECARKRDVDE